MAIAFQRILKEVSACTLCADHLPLGARPVFQLHPKARVLIAGQAPGKKVHETGVPFDDASGDRLRSWMGIAPSQFYDPKKVAILPMGFCYPGTGQSGDLPPRKECAEAWRERLLALLPNLSLILVIGQYALDWHMRQQKKKSLTDTVKAWRTFQKEGVLPLPHPSPRNNIWLKKNPWFEQEVLPELKRQVDGLLR